MRWVILVGGLLLAPLQAFGACTTGQTTCNTDTLNDATIANAIIEPKVQERVYELWLGQCLQVWPEAPSTAGHVLRGAYCDQIAAGGVSKELLTAAIMTPTVQSEVLSTSAGCNPPAGCMVDVDVVSAIDTALTVNVSTASTTATSASGSNSLTVASATGVVAGQTAYAVGIPNGAQVINVSGTTVLINAATTAALSTTPVFFTVSTGLPH